MICNNAGVSAGGPVWEHTVHDWEWVLGVNLWGVIHGIRAFTPLLIAQGEGHIVNTASIAGMISMPWGGTYNVSKHGVVTLSETLFADLAMTGAADVGVSVLCPGWVQTRIHEAGRNRPEGAETVEVDEERAAMRAGFADYIGSLIASGLEPAEVAAMVVDAIRTRRFYILTHPEWSPMITGRTERIVNGEVPACPRCPARSGAVGDQLAARVASGSTSGSTSGVEPRRVAQVEPAEPELGVGPDGEGEEHGADADRAAQRPAERQRHQLDRGAHEADGRPALGDAGHDPVPRAGAEAGADVVPDPGPDEGQAQRQQRHRVARWSLWGRCGTTRSTTVPIVTTLATVPIPIRSRSGIQARRMTKPSRVVTRPMSSPVRSAMPSCSTFHGSRPKRASTMSANATPHSTSPSIRRGSRRRTSSGGGAAKSLGTAFDATGARPRCPQGFCGSRPGGPRLLEHLQQDLGGLRTGHGEAPVGHEEGHARHADRAGRSTSARTSSANASPASTASTSSGSRPTSIAARRRASASPIASPSVK